MSNRPAKRPQAVPGPPGVSEDPLADLREPESDDRQPEVAPEDVQPDEGEDLIGVLVLDQESHDAAQAVMIAAWHQDTTALGFLHKGGRCGCRYIARVGLTAAVPRSGDLED